MKIKNLSTLILAVGFLLLLVGCGGDSSTSNTPTPQEKTELQRMDSLSVELDKTSNKIEEKTVKMKEDVDKLLEGI